MINLWEENNIPGYDKGLSGCIPNITPYLLPTDEKRGAVLVCPGGGYGGKAGHEGEPIALWLNSIGVSAFVLDYRVAPYKHPYPMLDAQRAIRYIRYNAANWNLDAQKIGILGFSAGGHLASTAGTHFDNGDQSSMDPIDRVSSRPDIMILCYPVISLGEYRHHGSMVNLIGENPPEELRDSLSNEKCITKDTPPAFLWHTANDQAVPVENSLMFASALRKHNINFSLHVFSDGGHGMGLAYDHPEAACWTELCESWLRRIDFI